MIYTQFICISIYIRRMDPTERWTDLSSIYLHVSLARGRIKVGYKAYSRGEKMLPQLLDILSLEEWGDMPQVFGDIALVKGFITDLMDECFHFEQQR